MIVHKNIRVTGKVQGVLYRTSTADKASSLGLKGFVLNEPTGSVYIEVEGEEPIVDQLVEWAQTGPPKARVDKVSVAEGVVQGFISFEVWK